MVPRLSSESDGRVPQAYGEVRRGDRPYPRGGRATQSGRVVASLRSDEGGGAAEY